MGPSFLILSPLFDFVFDLVDDDVDDAVDDAVVIVVDVDVDVVGVVDFLVTVEVISFLFDVSLSFALKLDIAWADGNRGSGILLEIHIIILLELLLLFALPDYYHNKTHYKWTA